VNISGVCAFELVLAQNYLKQECTIIYLPLEILVYHQYAREMYTLVS